MKPQDLVLGSTVTDLISGFTGIAVGVVTYVSGCVQVLVTPRVDADGKKRDAEWFDVQRVQRVGNEFIQLDNEPSPGGDMLPPKR